ncbi:3-keto-5-aminohexanoate cleavage protein [Alphaproteobacteria bacterium KMM 3653]|uniref:3-keto-5-aminohexanoate cleavage protein n=1 Tax=Harenicola maris TaxID=2841044 RepID=A0AAP2CPH3_9RHOB|nr:3-keto-5-aminohexanoate cleavage protein [Harenicola maris]
MTPLPRLMVAPNGARRGHADHAALPVTDEEVVQTARACQEAGADGIHLHIRDEAGLHLLDAGRYQALLDRLCGEVPGMYLQVTSEAAGRYSAEEQREMMRALRPAHVSVALREMVRAKEDWAEAYAFYHWAADNAVEVQHILYSPEEVAGFVRALEDGKIPGDHHLIQLVRGSYAEGEAGATPLAAYLAEMDRADSHSFDWMLCAFGRGETASLVEAAQNGGKARSGFENSLWNSDGSLAADNAARIREVDAALRAVSGPL